MKKIIIAGKTIDLTFSMADWEKMEDEICTLEEIDQKLSSKGRIRTIFKMVALLAHDELITENWLSLNVQPHQLTPLAQAINQAIIKALTRKDDDETAHDMILEELQKNAGQAD